MSVVSAKKTCLITVSEKSVPELPKAIILASLEKHPMPVLGLSKGKQGRENSAQCIMPQS